LYLAGDSFLLEPKLNKKSHKWNFHLTSPSKCCQNSTNSTTFSECRLKEEETKKEREKSINLNDKQWEMITNESTELNTKKSWEWNWGKEVYGCKRKLKILYEEDTFSLSFFVRKKINKDKMELTFEPFMSTFSFIFLLHSIKISTFTTAS